MPDKGAKNNPLAMTRKVLVSLAQAWRMGRKDEKSLIITNPLKIATHLGLTQKLGPRPHYRPSHTLCFLENDAT